VYQVDIGNENLRRRTKWVPNWCWCCILMLLLTFLII